MDSDHEKQTANRTGNHVVTFANSSVSSTEQAPSCSR